MTDWDALEARQLAALAKFRELCEPYMGLADWGRRVAAARRLEKAMRALREHRDAHNQRRDLGNGETTLAVRVVADALAEQIAAAAAAAGDGQDPATIAWVLAGLRCTQQPFCTGCDACQTITAPHRPPAGAVR